jgi:hypothetical protein
MKNTSLLDRFIHYRFNTYIDALFVHNDLFHIISELKNINLSIGYVKTSDIFNKTSYPIISEVITKFMDRDSWSKINNLERSKIYK